jgi:hypothetical protein
MDQIQNIHNLLSKIEAKMKMTNRISGVLVSGMVLFAGAAQADVVFNISGSNNCFPLGCFPQNYQQVYDASGFTGGAVDIAGLRFKVAQDGNGQAFGPTPITLTVDLSTTAITPSTITGNFATNRGANDQVVFSGTTLLSSSGGNVFDILIPFTSSFRFDPSAGNLLVGLNVTSGTTHTFFDAGYSPLVGRNYFGNPHGNYGLATQFVTTAVPEPESYAMMLAGLAGLGFMARRKKAISVK